MIMSIFLYVNFHFGWANRTKYSLHAVLDFKTIINQVIWW